MNRLALVCVCLLAAPLLVAAPKPKIMVQVAVAKELGFEKPDAIAQALEDTVTSQIRAAFPCAEYITPHDLRTMLNFARMRSLLGVPADQEADYQQGLKALGNASAVDYIVAVDAKALNGSCVFSGMWLDVRQVKALARSLETFPVNDGAIFDASRRIADKLLDQVSTVEICPFKGNFKATVKSTRDKSAKEEYPVYCNGSDAMYRKLTSDKASAETHVEIDRSGKRRGDATANELRYSARQETSLVEENGCYPCPSGRQGGRIYTQKTTTALEINGCGEMTYKDDNGVLHQRDAIEIRPAFKDDGTYILIVTVTSAVGTESVRE